MMQSSLFFHPHRQGRLSCLLLLLLLGSDYLSAQPFSEKLRLVFAGDIMGHSTQIAGARLPDGAYDYASCFRYVAPILRQADLAIGNLELTLPGSPPYTGYPQFRSPDTLAHALKEAGFQVLVTANNHSNDAGKIGLKNTIATLRGVGFQQTGTFLDSNDLEQHHPLEIVRGNFKLALLNYTYGTNGIPTPPPFIVNLIDENQIERDMARARSMQPDAILVFIHWGNEYQMAPSLYQQQLAVKLIQWGARIVIGAHPHVVQPVQEIVADSGTINPALVVYSLGNFVSGQVKPYTDLGAMVEVDLEKNLPFGEVCLTRVQHIPVFRYVHRGQYPASYHVLPASLFANLEDVRDPFPMPEAVKIRLREDLKVIRSVLSRHGIFEKPIFPNAVLSPIMRMETRKTD